MYLWKETQVDTKLLKYLNKRLTSLFSKSLNFTIQFEVINRGAFTILKNYENKLPNLKRIIAGHDMHTKSKIYALLTV